MSVLLVVGEALADDALGLRREVLGRVHDDRRLLLDPVAAVDLLGELLQRPEARAPARLREVLLGRLDRRLVGPGRELIHDVLDVDPGVPDVEEAHRRELGHRRPVGAARPRVPPRAAPSRWWPLSRAATTKLATSRLTSHSNGAGQRLVEVVEVEDEAAVGRREHAEVRQVRVTAALHAQPGRRGPREIPRHDRRAAAIERERRDDHAAVADRHEVGDPRRVLLLEHADGVRAVGGRLPLRVRLERHAARARRVPRRGGPRSPSGGRAPCAAFRDLLGALLLRRSSRTSRPWPWRDATPSAVRWATSAGRSTPVRSPRRRAAAGPPPWRPPGRADRASSCGVGARRRTVRRRIMECRRATSASERPRAASRRPEGVNRDYDPRVSSGSLTSVPPLGGRLGPDRADAPSRSRGRGCCSGSPPGSTARSSSSTPRPGTASRRCSGSTPRSAAVPSPGCGSPTTTTTRSCSSTTWRTRSATRRATPTTSSRGSRWDRRAPFPSPFRD